MSHEENCILSTELEALLEELPESIIDFLKEHSAGETCESIFCWRNDRNRQNMALVKWSSYQEVKSVVLHTLNRARFSVAVEFFLKTGRVPSLQEGNLQENIFSFPWLKDKPVVLGLRFKDAFQDPVAYLVVEPFFEKERYVVTYNPSKGKVYSLLKDQAKSDDILKAAFHVPNMRKEKNIKMVGILVRLSEHLRRVETERILMCAFHTMMSSIAAVPNMEPKSSI